MKNRYSTQDYKPDHMARVLGKDLGISTKKSIEVCSFLVNKTTKQAKVILENVVAKKQAIPFKRFNTELAHRPNIGPGRYPINVSKEILRLIKEVEANAQQKGLDTNSLVLKNMVANRASRPWHFGRQRRTKMKRTHIEIVVLEKAKKHEAKDKPAAKEKHQAAKKVENK